jgi:hypothetical protein
VGSVEVPRHDVGGIGLDFKLPTRTYIGVEALALKSKVDRRIGIFTITGPAAFPSGTDQQLRYDERSVRMIVNQMIGDQVFAQATYQFTRSDLDTIYPTIPAPAAFNRTFSDRADLHRVGASLFYQRPDGWFSQARATVLRQEASPISSDQPAFFDLFVGWRFPKLKGDITVGVLNIGDSDYKLYPLTAYEEFPRERTFYLRFRLNL